MRVAFQLRQNKTQGHNRVHSAQSKKKLLPPPVSQFFLAPSNDSMAVSLSVLPISGRTNVLEYQAVMILNDLYI